MSDGQGWRHGGGAGGGQQSLTPRNNRPDASGAASEAAAAVQRSPRAGPHPSALSPFAEMRITNMANLQHRVDRVSRDLDNARAGVGRLGGSHASNANGAGNSINSYDMVPIRMPHKPSLLPASSSDVLAGFANQSAAVAAAAAAAAAAAHIGPAPHASHYGNGNPNLRYAAHDALHDGRGRWRSPLDAHAGQNGGYSATAAAHRARIRAPLGRPLGAQPQPQHVNLNSITPAPPDWLMPLPPVAGAAIGGAGGGGNQRFNEKLQRHSFAGKPSSYGEPPRQHAGLLQRSWDPSAASPSPPPPSGRSSPAPQSVPVSVQLTKTVFATPHPPMHGSAAPAASSSASAAAPNKASILVMDEELARGELRGPQHSHNKQHGHANGHGAGAGGSSSSDGLYTATGASQMQGGVFGGQGAHHAPLHSHVIHQNQGQGQGQGQDQVSPRTRNYQQRTAAVAAAKQQAAASLAGRQRWHVAFGVDGRKSGSSCLTNGSRTFQVAHVKVTYSCCSAAGTSEAGQSKPNQDSWAAMELQYGVAPATMPFGGPKAAPPIAATQSGLLCSVFDGHGPSGGQISAFVSQALPRMLVTSTDFQAGRYSAAMATCFPACNAQLAASVGAATASSGCTGVCAWLMAEPAPPVVAAPAAADGGPGGAPYGNGAGPYGQVKLYVANLGDSRCVLGSLDMGGRLYTTPLTTDHSPDTPSEASRVMAAGGVVRPFVTPNGMPAGPLRVWAPGRGFPGLRMTRAFGDLASAAIGILDTPEIAWRVVTRLDKYLLVMTDGIFEFFQNEDVMGWVHKCAQQGMGPLDTAKWLVRKARQTWDREENGVIDDCSVIVMYLSSSA